MVPPNELTVRRQWIEMDANGCQTHAIRIIINS